MWVKITNEDVLNWIGRGAGENDVYYSVASGCWKALDKANTAYAGRTLKLAVIAAIRAERERERR